MEWGDWPIGRLGMSFGDCHGCGRRERPVLAAPLRRHAPANPDSPDKIVNRQSAIVNQS
jgi:hypothetical protein